MQKNIKTIAIVMAVVMTVSIPAYTYAKPAIGNTLLTAKVAAKKSIVWNSKTIFKKTVKIKKKLTVLGLTTLGNTHVKGNLALDNGLPLGSLTGLSAGQVILGNADGTPTATTLTGDVTVDSNGVTTLASGAVTVDEVANTTSNDGEVVDGVTKYRSISGDALLPLLNGESNTLTTFDAGTTILDVIVKTSTPSESAGTFSLGTDANWDEFANDADAFIANYDPQSGYTIRMTTLPESSPSISNGSNTVTANNAAMTIESSANMSNTNFTGSIVILYY